MRASCRSLRSSHTSFPRLYSTPESSSSAAHSQRQTTSTPQQPTAPDTSKRAASTLTAPKLRALVSLYHKTADYITPETLNSRIIYAFANPRLPGSLGSALRTQVDYPQLQDAVYSRRKLPRMVEANEAAKIEVEDVFQNTGDGISTPGSAKPDFWSGKRTTREQRVVNALYGVKGPAYALGPVLPGLEMLEEEAERIEHKNELHKKTQKNLKSL